MDAQHHNQELHWGWLVAFFLVLVIALFTFGDLLTAIVGILLLSTVFAGYYSEQQKDKANH